MRSGIAAMAAAAILVAGCGSGGTVTHDTTWSADDQQAFMDACKQHETSDFCGCAFSSVSAQYARPADLPNSKNTDDQTLADAAGTTAGQHPGDFAGC